jgi:hypothetical protein
MSELRETALSRDYLRSRRLALSDLHQVIAVLDALVVCAAPFKAPELAETVKELTKARRHVKRALQHLENHGADPA